MERTLWNRTATGAVAADLVIADRLETPQISTGTPRRCRFGWGSGDGGSSISTGKEVESCVGGDAVFLTMLRHCVQLLRVDIVPPRRLAIPSSPASANIRSFSSSLQRRCTLRDTVFERG